MTERESGSHCEANADWLWQSLVSGFLVHGFFRFLVTMLKIFKYYDWVLLASVLILTSIGIMMVYSTSLSASRESLLWVKQLLALGIGLGGLIFISNVDYRLWRKSSSILYILSVLLLLGLFFIATEIRGSRRWYDLGFINFQPAELSKFALLILLAKYFHVKGQLVQKFRYVTLSFLYALLPVGLIMMQPDLGSALVHVGIWVGALGLSAMPRRYFGYLLLIFLIFSVIAWQFLLADYQKNRVYTFIDPTADPQGTGYNVIQSIVAVGTGGVFGTGLARGLQSQLRFLPERQTDFIFAATSEELGLLGGGIVILLLVIILLRMLKILRQARDSFGTYLAGGIFFLILIQSVVNIGMNLGLLPVTGITLPFLSYGGSSLVINLFLIGIMENIARKSAPVKFK